MSRHQQQRPGGARLLGPLASLLPSLLGCGPAAPPQPARPAVIGAPGALTLDAPPAELRRAHLTLSGSAPPGALVAVLGGEHPATGRADQAGRFSLGVALWPNRTQELTVSLAAPPADWSEAAGTATQGAASAGQPGQREGDRDTPALRVTVRAGSTGRSRYPIVLVHGFWGFDRLLGYYPYWVGIPSALEAAGYDVYAPRTHPMASIATRGQLLREFLERLTSGPVHLIGHSMGGLDARWLAHQPGMAERIASITTIATPHRGSPLADIALGLLGGPREEVTRFVLGLWGADLAAVHDLTERYLVDEFNPRYPDLPGLTVRSWAGRADPDGATGCVIGADMRLGWELLQPLRGDNDGLVPVSSAIWGDFQGLIAADHLDQIGQVLGQVCAGFDHRGFMLRVVAGLPSVVPAVDHERSRTAGGVR